MSTSVAGLSSDGSKIYKNSFHWRSDSGELDVFEAARYFNDQAAAAVPAYINAGINVIKEDRHHGARTARRSLDVAAMRSNPISSDYHHHTIDQKQLSKDQNKIKFKQPSSPGGRIASFLNSLFNQTSLKKKKKSKAAGKDFEEESPGGRRKRRSSISHFRITSTAKNNAAADKASGFVTPPPYANTPTKSYKEFARFAVSLPVNGGSLNSEEKKLRVCDEKMLKNVGNLAEKTMGFRKLSDEDDGAESDSSSDLFDLPNHDLDFFSTGLPVYETTHVERIRIATPIST